MKRIVLVEDEKTLRKGLLMTTNWANYGCHVIGEAANGQEGLQLCLKVRPDIVITDIKMPRMDGIEMVKRVLEVYEPVIVFMSAFSEFEYAKKAIEFKVIDYLLKPFNDENLDSALKKAVKQVDEKQLLLTHNDSLEIKLRELLVPINSKHHNLVKAIEYIHHHYHEELSIGNVAEYLNVSESYLSHLFKEESNYTFLDYLTRYRLSKACQLLKNPTHRIHEIASQVGYRDQRYFSLVFRKQLGMTPKQFREDKK